MSLCSVITYRGTRANKKQQLICRGLISHQELPPKTAASFAIFPVSPLGSQQPLLEYTFECKCYKGKKFALIKLVSL